MINLKESKKIRTAKSCHPHLLPRDMKTKTKNKNQPTSSHKNITEK